MLSIRRYKDKRELNDYTQSDAVQYRKFERKPQNNRKKTKKIETTQTCVFQAKIPLGSGLSAAPVMQSYRFQCNQSVAYTYFAVVIQLLTSLVRVSNTRAQKTHKTLPKKDQEHDHLHTQILYTHTVLDGFSQC